MVGVIMTESVNSDLNPAKLDGLTGSEAAKLLSQHGPNVLTHAKGRSPWRIFFAQFASLLVALLAAAAVISFLLGDEKDAIAIAAIIILNGLLGFKQEFSAEKAMAALKKLAVPRVRVRRDGEVRDIDAAALVPGDVMLLEAGNVVPADGRLAVCAGLRVQEAALTGESESVEKSLNPVDDPNAAVGDRTDMVFMGTVITYGRAEAICSATGMNTELGRIATLLDETEEEPTPLTSKITHLGKVLVYVALGLIAVVAIMGMLRGDDPRTVFLTAVSMAVAAVPEGLPAVVTIALALGARRMLARQALIRNLPAVETLGSVTVVCTDKTGTLTRNQMTVTRLMCEGGAVDLSNEQERDALHSRVCLIAGALCNDAVVGDEVVGDPTEVALVMAAADAGINKAELEKPLPRVGEAPFDSDRKRMATLHNIGADAPEVISRLLDACGVESAKSIAFVKGAAASVLEVSSHVYGADGAKPLDSDKREKLARCDSALAGEGIRVLGLAFRVFDQAGSDMGASELEQDLVFVGLVGMVDPLRDDVPDSVASVCEAGIRPVMITGDHPLMAAYIGRQLGIVNEDAGKSVLSGVELASMSDQELQEAAKQSQVFARVSPEQKLKLVDALQADGEIVSMTGDGVNDAPALKSADIGVAMGITGSDVAKEAADMVLLDDRYATIVSAVKEGRVIFDNIRRFVRFILAANAGELLVMLVGPFLGLPLPLLPVQILWMNLVTDGLPALALGVEGPERDVMKRPPRRPDAPIIDLRMAIQIVWVGMLMAALSLFVGCRAWGGDAWQTMIFTTMVFAQLFLAMAVRSSRYLLLQIGIFSNLPLLGAIVVTFLLQLAVLYIPVCADFFHTVPLTPLQLATCIGFAVLLGLAVEVEKMGRWIIRYARKETNEGE